MQVLEDVRLHAIVLERCRNSKELLSTVKKIKNPSGRGLLSHNK